MSHTRTGVLLLQLGTPDSPSTSDVRRYLRQFLGDPRVLTMSAPLRWLLLNAVILPFRPRRSAHAYRLIWTEEGSPLLSHSERVAKALEVALGGAIPVEVGMRYGSPSIAESVDRLLEHGVDRIIALPQFPQYASAAGGSAVAAFLDDVASRTVVPRVIADGAFWDDGGFIEASAAAMRPALHEFGADHVLFSYHGLPESQIRDADDSGRHCLTSADCCATISDDNRDCYRAQCFGTTARLAEELQLSEEGHSTAFQSRLAGSTWIQPYTDKVLPGLYAAGVRRLAVATPSFTADCLETLEEIGIRGRDQWMELGGEDFLLLPCVNDHPRWIEALRERVERDAG